jgi:hypothetical protein
MAETTFNLYNYGQKLSVDPENISCNENTHVPTLVLPVRLDLLVFIKILNTFYFAVSLVYKLISIKFYPKPLFIVIKTLKMIIDMKF